VSPTEESPQVYELREGVRVFRSGDEIRFRKGVWNYNEATVRLAGQEEGVVRFFNALYELLVQNHEADPEAIGREVGASAEELASYRELLESLKSQQYLRDSEQKDASRAVSALLGGNLSGFEDRVGTPRPVLFFTDSDYARGAAKTLAGEIGLPLDILDNETGQELATADLTTRTDAIQYTDTASRLEKVFHPYSCVLGCVASPNLSMLRNLNRLLIRAEKPLVLGLIDGPFTTMLATLATQTGCFECFEQRMLARLEDTLVYHQFVESTTEGWTVKGPWSAPQMHMLTAAVVSEGYLYTTLGMMRLAGRIVNTYLPLVEIQVQDLLRVPYCPACGFISKAQMDEMYTSSKRVVTEMLAKVQLEG
jgi:thiazole/oxazole-forming peptide maturase SagC family component